MNWSQTTSCTVNSQWKKHWWCKQPTPFICPESLCHVTGGVSVAHVTCNYLVCFLFLKRHGHPLWDVLHITSDPSIIWGFFFNVQRKIISFWRLFIEAFVIQTIICFTFSNSCTFFKEAPMLIHETFAFSENPALLNHHFMRLK